MDKTKTSIMKMIGLIDGFVEAGAEPEVDTVIIEPALASQDSWVILLSTYFFIFFFEFLSINSKLTACFFLALCFF